MCMGSTVIDQGDLAFHHQLYNLLIFYYSHIVVANMDLLQEAYRLMVGASHLDLGDPSDLDAFAVVG